jgi:hypothetical protein
VVLTWAWNEVLLGNATVPANCNGGATGTNSISNAFSFTATANVLPQCGSYVTTNMDFGNVTGGIPANIDRTATLTLTCLKNTAYQVSLNNGQNNPPPPARGAWPPPSAAHLLPHLRAVPRCRAQPALGQHPQRRYRWRHRKWQRAAADHPWPGAAGHRPAPGRHLQRCGAGDDHLLTCMPTNGRHPPVPADPRHAWMRASFLCQEQSTDSRRYRFGRSSRYRAARSFSTVDAGGSRISDRGDTVRQHTAWAEPGPSNLQIRLTVVEACRDDPGSTHCPAPHQRSDTPQLPPQSASCASRRREDTTSAVTVIY